MEKILPDLRMMMNKPASKTSSETSVDEGSASAFQNGAGSNLESGSESPVVHEPGPALSAIEPAPLIMDVDRSPANMPAQIEINDAEATEMASSQADSVVYPEPKLEANAELVESIEAIPNKMAFKIGEAADMVGVKQYVLRYWESEFEMLRPRKSKNNQRVYSRRDVETALMIKKLLYHDRFSIEGARSALRALKTQVKAQVTEERGIKVMAQSQETAVQKLKGLLREIQRVRDLFG